MCAVTKSTDYDFSKTRGSYVAYVNQTDSGIHEDRGLNFHVSRGATIIKAVPAWRPEDCANEGHGVLIAYDLGTVCVKVANPVEVITSISIPCVQHAQSDAYHVLSFNNIRAQVLSFITSLLGHPVVDEAIPMMSMGLDSLDVTQLVLELNEAFGAGLVFTAVFIFPTVDKLAMAIYQRGQQFQNMSSLASQVIQFKQSDSAGGVAIIGMRCRFPGGIDGPAMFWDTLSSGCNCVTKVPLDRWDLDALAAFSSTIGAGVKRRIEYGCFMQNLEYFDSTYFKLSTAEALAMDPQQRLLLEYACLAFEDAGAPKGSLEGTNTGVFVGISGSDAAELNAGKSAGVFDINKNSNATASGRISFIFGLEGACSAYDTACSLSLVALHAAVRSLQNGNCDVALVIAVSAMLTSTVSMAFATAGMTSRTGRCNSFDDSADGYARAEGCGALLIKRLTDVISSNDHIHATVLGVAVAQDGTSSSLTAPNGNAQEKLLRCALRDARSLSGDQVGFFEAHGTGTPLGDPIEMGAVAAMVGDSQKGMHVAMGSAKACVGHLEPAAGMVGLIKAVLVL